MSDDLSDIAEDALPGDFTIQTMHFTDGDTHRRAIHHRDYHEFDGGYSVKRWILHGGNTEAKCQRVVVYE